MNARERASASAVASTQSAVSAALVMAAALALALLVLLASPIPAVAFPDVPSGHPYAVAIGDLSARGIISGYDDGTFGPDDLVLRQQFAKMICRTLALAVVATDKCPFPDVEQSLGPDPLYPGPYVAKAAATGITMGYDDGTFRPYVHISRAHLVTMVVRALSGLHPSVLGAPPAAYVASWADSLSGEHLQNARTAEINGLLLGLPLDGAASDPWAPMPRGEVAQVLHNVLLKLASPPLPPAGGRLVRVGEVVSGDTIVIDEPDGSWVVRLIGADAPETGQPYARDAKQTLEHLVDHKSVWLSYDVYPRDAYGSLWAYVWLDRELINATMLGSGLVTYPPNTRVPPQKAEQLQNAARQAAGAQKGAYSQVPSVEDFFAAYPTDGDIYEIDWAYKLVFEYDPTAGQSSGGSLTPLQKRVYKVLQFMRLVRFNEPLAWTDLLLYGWFFNSCREIHFENIEMSYFQDGVMHIASRPNSFLCLTDLFIDPTSGGGLMDSLVLFVHEARHAQIGHWDGTNDHNLAELGSWGVQYLLYGLLADHSNFYLNDYAKERLQIAADSVKAHNFTDGP